MIKQAWTRGHFMIKTTTSLRETIRNVAIFQSCDSNPEEGAHRNRVYRPLRKIALSVWRFGHCSALLKASTMTLLCSL